ncbi:unnamed protein product [Ostreobium quekettii]|uniref:Uncharacterized protein n=1 Tax=Ostreobium quekettii TaxID=121088 RepID=A0A8S1IY64_9CHLO|nr:unnamed protein product [Ostreobium quekettii]
MEDVRGMLATEWLSYRRPSPEAAAFYARVIATGARGAPGLVGEGMGVGESSGALRGRDWDQLPFGKLRYKAQHFVVHVCSTFPERVLIGLDVGKIAARVAGPRNKRQSWPLVLSATGGDGSFCFGPLGGARRVGGRRRFCVSADFLRCNAKERAFLDWRLCLFSD